MTTPHRPEWYASLARKLWKYAGDHIGEAVDAKKLEDLTLEATTVTEAEYIEAKSGFLAEEYCVRIKAARVIELWMPSLAFLESDYRCVDATDEVFDSMCDIVRPYILTQLRDTCGTPAS